MDPAVWGLKKISSPAFGPDRGAGVKVLSIPGTDEIQGRGKNLIGIQIAGVQLKGVPGRLQRGHDAFTVAGVAFLHIRENAAMYNVEAPFPQLFKTPIGANLDTGGDEDFDVGVGTDDGTDIAAVEDRPWDAAGGRGGEVPLERNQQGADGGKGRHPGRRVGGSVGTQIGRFQVLGLQSFRRRLGRHRVARVISLANQVHADGPVKKPGIQERQAEMAGQPAGQRTLAGGGGAVDGDDHRPILRSRNR